MYIIYIYMNSTYRFISFHVLAKVEPCASIRAAVFISDACIRSIPWSPWSLFILIVSADLSRSQQRDFRIIFKPTAWIATEEETKCEIWPQIARTSVPFCTILRLLMSI